MPFVSFLVGRVPLLKSTAEKKGTLIPTSLLEDLGGSFEGVSQDHQGPISKNHFSGCWQSRLGGSAGLARMRASGYGIILGTHGFEGQRPGFWPGLHEMKCARFAWGNASRFREDRTAKELAITRIREQSRGSFVHENWVRDHGPSRKN